MAIDSLSRYGSHRLRPPNVFLAALCTTHFLEPLEIAGVCNGHPGREHAKRGKAPHDHPRGRRSAGLDDHSVASGDPKQIGDAAGTLYSDVLGDPNMFVTQNLFGCYSPAVLAGV